MAEIGAITSNTPLPATGQTGAARKAADVATDAATDKAHEKLRKATREMESYFVGTLLKKMHESAAKGGLFGDNSQSDTYRDMFDDAVAKEIGHNGSFGIADSLYRELVTNVEASKK